MFKFHVSLLLVIGCVACGGASFSSNDGGSLAGAAGDASAGQASSAGSSNAGDGGAPSEGGTSAGGGAAGNAGASAGSGGDSDCAKLKQQFQGLLEKARVCDRDATDQCSPSSTVEPLGCGCAVLVNAKGVYTDAARKARQAYLDAKCMESGVCPAIACVAIKSASCAAAATGDSFVCTAGTPVLN
ncbi:MAG TPA: hypothetical protein VFK05_28575 [Polyangiaceae bacterium]|nr:hypothetical protein [Polyangiaceae bacterium]